MQFCDLNKIFPDLVWYSDCEQASREPCHRSVRCVHECECVRAQELLRVSLGFLVKGKVWVRLVGPYVPLHFQGPFTGFGIYWALCSALNLYWDLHCEMTPSKYQPWEMEYWQLARNIFCVYSVRMFSRKDVKMHFFFYPRNRSEKLLQTSTYMQKPECI